MTDYDIKDEDTQYDDDDSLTELPPGLPILDPPLTLDVFTDYDSEYSTRTRMGPVSNRTPPVLNEVGEAAGNSASTNEMATSSSASPKRPWSAVETNESTSDDSNNIPTKKCKICNLTACIDRYHLEKVNEMVQKNNELKKKINKANELNARLDAIIQDLDTQCPMNKDIIRALLRSEPEDIDLNFDGDE